MSNDKYKKMYSNFNRFVYLYMIVRFILIIKMRVLYFYILNYKLLLILNNQ